MTQTWPATAIGAAEFRRTQAKRAAGSTTSHRPGCLGARAMSQAWWSKPLDPPAPPNHRTQPRSVLASVQDTIEHWDLRAGTKAVLALPTSFVAGQAMLIRAVEGAWDFELSNPRPRLPGMAPKTSWPSPLTKPKAGCSTAAGRPKRCCWAAAPFPFAVESLLASGRVEALWESYGLSESMTHVATRKIQSVNDLIAPFTPLQIHDHQGG